MNLKRQNLSLISMSALLLACLWVVAPAQADTAQPDIVPPHPAPSMVPRAVIELYTSQGCADCVAADALLKSYADQSDIIALTFPVDYWDYLGWKDTFATARYSERQRAYAARFDAGPVSTPQAIVNGASYVLGSSADEIERAISATATATSARRVAAGIWSLDQSIVIEVGATSDPSNARDGTVWLVAVQRLALVTVKAGENKGKSLTYTNLVRGMFPVGSWNGRPTTIHLAKAAINNPETDDLFVLVQEANTGPIIGAARLPSTRSQPN